MSREREANLEQLFQRAADLPSHERDAYLVEMTAGDAGLLAEVRLLLAEYEGGTSGILTYRPSRESAADSATAGVEIDDRYRLLEILGEGGLGVVWLAEQVSPLRRQVAIKLIKPGMDSQQVLARFEAERQALARMDHPGIARVYDAGLTKDGRPYFVMEHVPGSPLVAFCDEARLTTRERLLLFIQICDSVHHAHRKGIIHRDIKPSNILVTRVDERPIAKVIDFGIAKAMIAPLTERPFVTVEGQVIGTPAYMSPEQADGSSVDSTTDVYSLGVTLYQLLTGALPGDPIPLRNSTPNRAGPQRSVAGAVRPSSRVKSLEALGAAGTEVAAARRTDPRRLAHLLRGDLDWIVLKAIDEERERRYPSASELGADIQRHLDGELVRAGPPSLRREAFRFVRRHPAFVGALAATFVAFAIGVSFAVLAARREAELREISERGRYRSNLVAAAAALASGNASLARRSLDEALPRFRGWEWRYLNWKCDRSLWTLRFKDLDESFLREFHDGERLLGNDRTGKIVVRDATRGEVLATYETNLVDSIAIPSSDGRFALVVGFDSSSESEERSRRGAGAYAMWDLVAGTRMWHQPGRPGVSGFSFSPDASEVALLAADSSRFFFVDVRTGAEKRSFALEPTRTPALVGLLSGLAVIRDDDGVRGIDSVTGATIWRHEDRMSTDARLDSERRRVLLPGLRQHRPRILDARTGELLDTPLRIGALMDASGPLALQIDGTELVVVDVATAREHVRLPGHTDSDIVTAQYLGKGSRIGSTSSAHEFKMWSAETSEVPFRFEQGGVARDVHARAGRSAFSTWGLLQVWDVSVGTVSWSRMFTRFGEIPAAAFSPTCDSLVVDPGRGPLLRLDATDGRELGQLADPPGDATCLEWMPDGSALIVGGADGDVYVCDSSTSQVIRILRGHDAPVRVLAVRDDGSLLVTGAAAAPTQDDASAGRAKTSDFELRIWDARTGEALGSIDARAAGARGTGVSCLAFDPTGRRLAIGSQDGWCDIYDFEVDRITVSIHRERAVSEVHFMGSSRLAIGYPDTRVHVHDVSDGGFLLELEMWGEEIDFDGERLVSSSFGGPVCIAEATIPSCGYHARALASRARAVVDALPRHLLLARDVAAEIARLDLSSEVLQEATRYAVRRGENANDLNSEAWNIARKVDRPEAELQLALRLAERADAIWPDDWAIVNTIAALHLRSNRNAEAIEQATRSNDLLFRAGRELHPVNFLILAIAHARRSEHSIALANLAAAQRFTGNEPHVSDRDTMAFLQDATELLNP